MSNTDVVKLYLAVAHALSEETEYRGLNIIFDEFSKFLEANLDKSRMLNLKIIQDMAEVASRSGSKQIHFTCVTHKDILEYSSSDSFKTVEGRFTKIRFVSSEEQSYELIANAIVKKPNFPDLQESFRSEFQELTEKPAANIFDELCAEGITVAPLKCNACGQMFIQRMLLPPEERQAHFDYIDQREDSVPVENEEENGEENEEETEEREERNSPANTLITLDEAILLLDLLIKEGQLGWSRSMTADEASKALRALKAASGGAVPESFRTAGGLSGRLRQLSGTFQSGISSTTVAGPDI